MKKITLLIVSFFFTLLVFSITVTNPLGPTVVPVTGLMEDTIEEEVEINVSLWKDANEAVALLVSNQADFAVLPITVGANLYAQGLEIILLGVHEWKAFYLVGSSNVDFEDVKSLKGCEIYSPHGRGQTVDVLMRYLLVRNGLVPDKDVKFSYLPPQEIVSLFKAGKVEYAALPEPFATLAITGTEGEIILDFQNEWNKISGSKYGLPIAGLFVKKEILEKEPDIVSKVENAFSESVEWANINLDQSLKITNEYLTIPVPILKEAMNRLVFEYIPIVECKEEVDNFLNTMHELYPEGLPALPTEGFYYR
ncbi:nitrate ABC transporter substrate-binding protein [Petrotoga miotherma DSM 10691]|jgi:NitT/TauT family transport system substrate-binding protein|uniref:Nitrate ABC transporter substrate-binding protein n=2 Tax=Petrotoga TaxID=28236 RepID=A0A2K1PC56_9BACT|nr:MULTISPECIES: ABC transporter substrate-binding protein [Petrotoga]MDK2906666.1 NitT/TauT family transport system substrate-binding protein [Petrotoga sp.]PNS00391.1 nitrate ABC transporter substrate-binding protein [Petrotoga miotherma DSM 10691]POZ92361.1 nitrate ABC transporter substrate-binding protein [Petrotoga halophila DSM 16923]